MVRKRKLTPKSTESAEPPLKQHQSEPEQYNAAEEECEKVQEEVEVDEEEENDDDENEQEEEVEEPIQKLLEPLSKEQILSLLCEAATEHRDVADLIRRVADDDAVHRKIFVHGLGWDTSTGTLIKAFQQYGEIEDCKAVTDKVSGKSKGYGFILFKTRRGARNALREPHKKIGNRMTACQLASIGPVQQQPAAQQQQQPASSIAVSEYTQRKIYVSNVGAELDPLKLYAFFSQFGEIEEGPLGLDKITGKPKGFCLFVYKSADSAKRALDQPHKEFEGHILHCQKAIDGPKPGKSQQHVNPQSLRPQFQRNESAAFVSGGVAAQQVGHLMAPSGPMGIGFNQAATAQALNPALGQALTALLASQGATLELTNLLGGLGSNAAVNPGVPAVGHGVQGGYSAQPNISSGVIGGYGNQIGLQMAYPNQQIGQGGSGRGQYGGVPPYMGH